jgi:hypothetical protein
MEERTYIGDGVYVEHRGYDVRIFTYRGDYVHEIYLDLEMIQRLMNWSLNNQPKRVEVDG